jgi:hypothetical protein
MSKDSNWLFYYNDHKLYVIVELTETYSDDFGLSTFDFKFFEFRNYATPLKYQSCTRMARKCEDIVLSAEQAKDQYPEFFI